MDRYYISEGLRQYLVIDTIEYRNLPWYKRWFTPQDACVYTGDIWECRVICEALNRRWRLLCAQDARG